MDEKQILKILQQDIHTVIMATNDQLGNIYTCAMDLMLLEDHYLYFLTARGKSLYQRLITNPKIALTGLKGKDTMSSIAISLQGEVRKVSNDKLKIIFDNNPYMKEIYPNQQARDVLEVFVIDKYTGEYFDLSQKPIYRQSFAYHQKNQVTKYFINEKCQGCLKCLQVCPQNCIDSTTLPFTIKQNHCLHCGKCQEVCKYQAINKGVDYNER
ncbi:MAG: 4Fe-4S binding protein [Thomasclavelia sp.]